MATNNDLSALLPDPPPPRPARRDAAIEEALRRFDAGGQLVSPAPVAPRPARRFEGWGRPQIAALASVALVVLVSVPIWWSRDQLAPDAPSTAPVAPVPAAIADEPSPPASQQATLAEPATPAPSVAAAPIASIDAPSAPSAASSAPAASADESAAVEVNLNRLPAFSPPASPPVADTRGSSQSVGQASARMAPAPPPPAPPPPPPPATAKREVAEAEADRQIVVTGSRVARPDYTTNSPTVSVDQEFLRGGDPESCTLLDPRRDLSACCVFADPALRGTAGRAGAHLADGLTFAWNGDLDRAIDSFGRAIIAAPDLSIAYLNRGLAWQEKGDFQQALADLNRAVAKDPGSARGYYHRSLLYEAMGDSARADTDARRAIERDPSYADILR